MSFEDRLNKLEELHNHSVETLDEIKVQLDVNIPSSINSLKEEFGKRFTIFDDKIDSVSEKKRVQFMGSVLAYTALILGILWIIFKG